MDDIYQSACWASKTPQAASRPRWRAGQLLKSAAGGRSAPQAAAKSPQRQRAEHQQPGARRQKQDHREFNIAKTNQTLAFRSRTGNSLNRRPQDAEPVSRRSLRMDSIALAVPERRAGVNTV
jgi:hypothetical protein